MKIKDLEITKEMYERALEVENAWKDLRKVDKDNNASLKDIKLAEMKWIRLDNAFQNEVNSDFTTLEIINEYQRRNEQ